MLGPILGPVIGGLILNFLDWRWLFWVNVPFCVVGIVLAIFLLPSDHGGPRIKLDVVGLVLLSPAMVGVLYGLSNVGKDGGFGRADVLIPLIGGVALLVGFVLWALRRRDRALIDVRLLRHRPLAASTALLFLTGVLAVRRDAAAAALLAGGARHGRPGRRTAAHPAGARQPGQPHPGRSADRPDRPALGRRRRIRDRRPGHRAVRARDRVDERVVPDGRTVRPRHGPGCGDDPADVDRASSASSVPRCRSASIITRLATQVGGSFGVAVLAVILHAAAAGATTPADVADAFDQAFWWAVGFGGLGMVLALLLPGRPSTVAAAPPPSPELIEAEAEETV